MTVPDLGPLMRLRLLGDLLGPMADSYTVVGASCASLFPPGRIPIRPTEDIDLIVPAATYSAWAQHAAALGDLGFHVDPDAATMCRLVGRGLVLDIIGFPWDQLGTNRWYPDSWHGRARDPLTGLHYIPPLWFLATKLEAFRDRGRADPMMSDDLADIVILLRNETISLDEVLRGTEPVHAYIRAELAALVRDQEGAGNFSAHFEPDSGSQEQARRLIRRLRGLR